MLTQSERIRKAIISGNLPITKRLLSRFPDLWLNTDPENNGWSNLHYASYHGNYLVCFHLVSVMGRDKVIHPDGRPLCDLDLLTFDNLTVLHMPIFHQHFQTLHFLLQEFAGNHWIDFKGGPLQRTPLQYCCACNFADGFKLLLEYGADWTCQDLNGDTCLHLCFAYSDLACVQELIRHIVAQKVSAFMESESKTGLTNESRARLKQAISQEIDSFEAIVNEKNSTAIAYASTFDLENKYLSSKDSWIETSITEELALLNKAPWDSSFWSYSNSEQSSRKQAFPPASATSSLATYTNAPASMRASVDSDLNALSSMATESSESISRQTLTEEGSTITEDNVSVLPTGRKHSRSLPPAADLTNTDATLTRPHSNSLVGPSRISPLQSRPAIIPQSVGYPTSPLSVEFTRTQTRKSGAPSPSSKTQKSERLSTPEEQQTDHPKLKIDVGLARKSSVSNTPSSAKSSHRFHFSPLRLVRSRSASTSISAPPSEERTRVEDILPKARASLSRASGGLQKQSSSNNIHRSSPTSTIPSSSYASQESLASNSKRLSGRSSNADLPRMGGSQVSLGDHDSGTIDERSSWTQAHESPLLAKHDVDSSLPTPTWVSTPTFRNISSFKVDPIQESFEPESLSNKRNISSISFNRVREES